MMFVYREEYYLARGEPGRRPEESDEKYNERYERWHNRLKEKTGEAEPTSSRSSATDPSAPVTLRFDHVTTRFEDYVRGDHLPEERY